LTRIIAAIFVLLSCGFFYFAAASGNQTSKVSLEDVLKDPAKYNGRTIQTHGFLLHEFENDALYVNEKWQRAKGIWIEPTVDMQNLREMNRRYVIVTGTFYSNQHGHLGRFKGTLKIKKLPVAEGVEQNQLTK
jgi:hypothetical protein